MNNTAGRAEAGQQSHPLLSDGHKTNALLWDRVWLSRVSRQESPEGGARLTAWPRERDRECYLFIYRRARTTCPNLCRCNNLAAPLF